MLYNPSLGRRDTREWGGHGVLAYGESLLLVPYAIYFGRSLLLVWISAFPHSLSPLYNILSARQKFLLCYI